MRDGWVATSLREVVEHTIGGVWGGESGTDEVEVTVVRSTEFTKRGFLNFETGVPRSIKSSQLKSRELKPGDILLEKSGGGPDQPVGRVVFVTEAIPEKFVCSNFVQLVRPNSEQIEPLLLFHIMWQWHAINRTLEFQAQTTGIRNLRTPDYLEQEISLPPLPEQKRIVDLISSVDSYIESLQQQLESAKKSRNAVLHELMTARGNDWVVRKLPEVVEVLDRMRKPINSTEREDRKGNIPYYGANGQTGWIDEFIFNEELVLLGEDAIDFADPSARKAYLIQGPSWVNNHAHVLRADKTIVNSYFLMESLNKVDYSQYVSFGTRSKLTQASMNGIKLLIPPMNIQEKFVDLLENFDKVIEATQRSIEDSKELRTGMLSNLLSGEHEIPANYDKFIGAA
jgi:type I restriction enzyme S subunit